MEKYRFKPLLTIHLFLALYLPFPLALWLHFLREIFYWCSLWQFLFFTFCFYALWIIPKWIWYFINFAEQLSNKLACLGFHLRWDSWSDLPSIGILASSFFRLLLLLCLEGWISHSLRSSVPNVISTISSWISPHSSSSVLSRFSSADASNKFAVRFTKFNIIIWCYSLSTEVNRELTDHV